MTRHRTRGAHAAQLTALAALALLVAATFAIGCGATSKSGGWDSRSIAESITGIPFTPLVVNSNVGRGPTRLALALLKADQTLVLQADITARIYRIDDEPEQHPDTAALHGTYTLTARTIDTADHGVRRLVPLDRDGAGRARVDVALHRPPRDPARSPAHDGALSAIFTTMIDFPEAGRWGADLDITTGGTTYEHVRLTFAVRDHTAEPAVGDAVPLTTQPIAAGASDPADATARATLADLDSSSTPHPALHDITVADAIASGRPAVVAFVTPAFCQTRFCGPVLNNVIVPVQQRYGERLHVIHIEPYDLPTARTKGTLTLVPAAVEWRLESEPFIAVVDGHGRMTAKFEGIIDLDEVTQAVDAMLAAG